MSETDPVLSAFAARMHEICDDMGLPAVRGRQTALAAKFGVDAKAARKWLLGIGFPEMSTAIRIADWAGVNVLWLLQGVGPKRGQHIDARVLVLDEAVKSLPPELGTDLIDNLRAKLLRVGKLHVGEPHARYATMLESYEKDFAKRR